MAALLYPIPQRSIRITSPIRGASPNEGPNPIRGASPNEGPNPIRGASPNLGPNPI